MLPVLKTIKYQSTKNIFNFIVPLLKKEFAKGFLYNSVINS
jgi:hypothetical protein